MPISSRDLIRSTSAFLLIGFSALMAIVAMNFWLGERAQSYFERGDRGARHAGRGGRTEKRDADGGVESARLHHHRQRNLSGALSIRQDPGAAAPGGRWRRCCRPIRIRSHAAAPSDDPCHQVRGVRSNDRAQADAGRRGHTGHLSHQQRQGPDRRSQCVFRRDHRKGRRSADVGRRRAARQHRDGFGSSRRSVRSSLWPSSVARPLASRATRTSFARRATRSTRSTTSSSSGSPGAPRTWRRRAIGPKCCCPRSITGSPTAWPSSRRW